MCERALIIDAWGQFEIIGRQQYEKPKYLYTILDRRDEMFAFPVCELGMSNKKKKFTECRIRHKKIIINNSIII